MAGHENSLERDRFDAITELLRVDGGLDSAWVFGSAARDALRPDSDIDLAVRWTPGRRPRGVPRALIGALMEATGREVHLVDLDEASQALRFQVFRNGHLLFDRSPQSTRRLHERTLIERFDWAPLEREIEACLARRFGQRRESEVDRG